MRWKWWSVCCYGLWLAGSGLCADDPRGGSEGSLENAASLYLRQHADDPVKWHPWSDAIFEKARKEGKPVFLSVGYATCHWCHVMAEESFRDPEIAEFLNAHFINVKVDREERPDVDRFYMQYLQAIHGRGGWPMSVWLTPDGNPFFAGTYFPPEARHGLPAFRDVLERIQYGWQHEREAVLTHGENFVRALKEAAKRASVESGLATAEWRSQAARALLKDWDEEFGGFGRDAKFPQAGNILFLLDSDEPQVAVAARQSLGALVDGTLHDPLGGGFHRYSVDREWQVPHFEKMLSDQARISQALVVAIQQSDGKNWISPLRRTLDFVLGEMQDPEGGFYSALDARSEREDRDQEGGYYLWRWSELEKLLPVSEREKLFRLNEFSQEGNVDRKYDPENQLTGWNVLSGAFLRAVSEDSLRALRLEQKARSRPAVDTKRLTGWNGLMISALAQGGILLQDSRYNEAAERAAKIFLGSLPDGLPRIAGETSTPGFLEDYAFFIGGLLDLYEATGKPEYLRAAFFLQDKQDALFFDLESGGYYFTKEGDATLPVRLQDATDGAEPAAVSATVMNLARLARILGGDKYQNQAESAFRAVEGLVARNPGAFPDLLRAQRMVDAPLRQAVISGTPGDHVVQAMLRTLRSVYAPDLVIIYAQSANTPGLPPEFSEKFSPFDVDESGQLFLCENFVCHAPTEDPKKVVELFEILKKK